MDFFSVINIKAPDFPQNFKWIATDKPLSLQQLKGHIVILDFWTYCCINCMHVLSTLKKIEEKYRYQPVVVIGVHSNKFDNETDEENIRNAVFRYNVPHPVIIDQRHRIWDAYAVNAWPTLVIIDPTGKIEGKYPGEANFDELDHKIQVLLSHAKLRNTLAKEKISITSHEKIPQTTLSFPGKLFIDTHERMVIANSNKNQILVGRLKNPLLFQTDEIVGSGEEGLQDGNFQEAKFHHPQGVYLMGNDLYVADTENHAIRLINLQNKTVTTIAGTGKQGFRDYGKALRAHLNSPWDILFHDNYLYIAMAGNHQIARLDLEKKSISAFAGSGQEGIYDGPAAFASLAQTSGLDSKNNILYFADSETSSIRTVTLTDNPVVQTLIGTGLFDFGNKDGDFDIAQFQHCIGLGVATDTIYVADTYNHAIRRMDLQKKAVSTLIKRQSDKKVCMIGDESCKELPLSEPNDVQEFQGKLYIADTNNHLIRVFELEKKILMDLKIV